VRDLKSVKTDIEKQLASPASEISIIELVDLLVEYGYVARSSDVHIEPAAEKVLIRYRIDGILHDGFTLAKDLQPEIVTRIKVLSGLKTDIHHVPQDGRIKVKFGDSGSVDVRVSIAPTYYGENCVMRILAEAGDIFNLEDLGFTMEQLTMIGTAIRKPYGMILANGPTGSGKTTTLYTMIKKLNTRERSIITIEDPIEYSIEGITQIPVNVQAGLTFATGLRSILRQDPNVVMVGEIRDAETATIAVNAALTGHLMLSTIHTNDAATTFPRLIDMGIPPFLVSSTVNIAIAQRLVRVVCKTCRVTRPLSADEVRNLSGVARKISSKTVYTVGKGCNDCDGIGYRSRIGIHEVLEINDEIRSLINQRADASQIKQAAIAAGMKTMIEDGIGKAVAGTTTIEEIFRIIHE
jgi:type II secretory ATPase GspE/PulE/Tfp pilus assembly ATPase PilB-like protein